MALDRVTEANKKAFARRTLPSKRGVTTPPPPPGAGRKTSRWQGYVTNEKANHRRVGGAWLG